MSLNARSLQRAATGWAANRSGASFEAELDRAHAAYLAAGFADIDRLPVPTRPTGNGGQRVLSERQRYDYCGCLMMAGPAHAPRLHFGRFVAMEAKASAERKTRLPISFKGQGISPHQLEALADKHTQGAVAALVWRNGPDRLVLEGARCVDAWRRYDEAGTKGGANKVRPRGTASIPAGEFTEYELATMGGEPELEDWLGTVLVLYESSESGR